MQSDAERIVKLLGAGFDREHIAAILGTDTATVHAVLSDPEGNDLPAPAAGGGGGAPQLPDLSAEINPDLATVGLGFDEDGAVPGPTNFWLRESTAYNNDTGELDPDTDYLVVAAYVAATDADWGGLDIRRPGSGFGGFNQARLVSFDGPATNDSPGIRSAVLPAGADLGVILGTAGCRLINVQLWPLATSSGGGGGGGGGQLDYNAWVAPAGGFTASGMADAATPVNADISNVIFASLNLASGGTGGIEIDGWAVVQVSGGVGWQNISAEVPPGATYRVFVGGEGSSVADVSEVPRG